MIYKFLFLLLSFVVAGAKAQSEEFKIELNRILSVYERQASVYLDKAVKATKHPVNWSTEQIRNVNLAMRMSQNATIENISKEAREKYNSHKEEAQLIRSYLDDRYRSVFLNLPAEFFEKVSNELGKE